MSFLPLQRLTTWWKGLPRDGDAGPIRTMVHRTPALLRVLLVLTIIPILEYALLVWISQQIGFLLTLGLVLASGAIGAWLVRKQGLIAWARILDSARRDQPFGDAMFDGALIVFAGVLLITPGVLTDIIGFALLFPDLRAWVKEKLASWLRKRAMTQLEAMQRQAVRTVIDIPPGGTTSPTVPTQSTEPSEPPPSELGAG